MRGSSHPVQLISATAICSESTTQSFYNDGLKSRTIRANNSVQKHFRIRGGDGRFIDEKRKIRLMEISPLVGTKNETETFEAVLRFSQNRIHSKKLDSIKMYLNCIAIVSVWVIIGTLFYSWFNEWPLPQSFFYAVDAGMSIGFCTDVQETKLASRAFTIVFILLGASCVGGALALFVKDIMMGSAVENASHREYRQLLERNAFRNADINNSGTLSYDEFCTLVKGLKDPQKNDEQQQGSAYLSLSEEALLLLCQKFDRSGDGQIDYHEFIDKYRNIRKFLQATSFCELHCNNDGRVFGSTGIASNSWGVLKSAVSWLFDKENRIFVAFGVWINIGITWGRLTQGWDFITSTHFAVSALATGGLTAPSVGKDGIMPAQSALFCGIYCLFGIPLFALTIGHFARVLVESHISAAEYAAVARPFTNDEFNFAKSLCTKYDDLVHLGDFIVLQLLRQGKISFETVEIMRSHFYSLDTNNSGGLTYHQAKQHG